MRSIAMHPIGSLGRCVNIGEICGPPGHNSAKIRQAVHRVKKALILVVEDEAIIRLSAVQLIEDARFDVMDAPNADSAIQLLESRRDIRAVFTDIQMPGTLDGLRLVHVIRERWPPIHLIVTSGLNAPSEAEFPANGRFIPKPYEGKTVLAMLDELFGPNPNPYRYMACAAQNYGRVAYR